jgi:ribosomal protein L40E
MAFCMKCGQEVPDLTIECPHCGQDFLRPPKTNHPEGWEYSGLADIVLMVGAAASGLSAVILSCLLLGAVIPRFIHPVPWPSHLQTVGGLCLGVCLSMAHLVVFLRVSNLSHNRSDRVNQWSSRDSPEVRRVNRDRPDIPMLLDEGESHLDSCQKKTVAFSNVPLHPQPRILFSQLSILFFQGRGLGRTSQSLDLLSLDQPW